MKSSKQALWNEKYPAEDGTQNAMRETGGKILRRQILFACELKMLNEKEEVRPVWLPPGIQWNELFC